MSKLTVVKKRGSANVEFSMSSGSLAAASWSPTPRKLRDWKVYYYTSSLEPECLAFFPELCWNRMNDRIVGIGASDRSCQGTIRFGGVGMSKICRYLIVYLHQVI